MIKTQEVRIEDLISENEMLKSRCAGLEETKENIVQKYKDVLDQNTQYDRTISKQTERIALLEENRDESANRIDERDDEINSYLEEVERLEAKIKNLKLKNKVLKLQYEAQLYGH